MVVGIVKAIVAGEKCLAVIAGVTMTENEKIKKIPRIMLVYLAG